MTPVLRSTALSGLGRDITIAGLLVEARKTEPKISEQST
jgi:hypothetical protein